MTARIVPEVIPRCSDCAKAVVHATAGEHLYCTDSVVNRAQPGYLAGRSDRSKLCYDERRNVVGACGRYGDRFAPKRDA
jgi:hypothetical protein